MSSTEHEDVAAHAGAKVGQWVALAATAAEAMAQIAAARAAQRAERDGREAAATRTELRARYACDRLAWAPMLKPASRDIADVPTTGRAWAAAQSWRGDPEADQAATLATDRLRQLRPDVMRLYDRAVAEGRGPVEAMRDAAPLMDRADARHDPGQARQALTEGAALVEGEGVGRSVVDTEGSFPERPGAMSAGEIRAVCADDAGHAVPAVITQERAAIRAATR